MAVVSGMELVGGNGSRREVEKMMGGDSCARRETPPPPGPAAPRLVRRPAKPRDVKARAVGGVAFWRSEWRLLVGRRVGRPGAWLGAW